MLLTLVILGAIAAPTDDVSLSRLVWERSVDLQAARARIALANADAAKANLLPNPGLDVSYNTIPLGERNPSSEPFFNVPNLQVGVSELVELGKRGPRQASMTATARATTLDTIELHRQRFYDLKEVYADIATSQARIASISQLVDGATRLRELEQARTTGGETSSIDLDRARVEEEKLRSALAEEKERLRAGLRTCAMELGEGCEPFADSAAATVFLETLSPNVPSSQVERRPDLRSLEAQGDAARAAATLAGRRAIPDLTVRVGYVKDWFVVSGNQPNSLFVGVSLPLPLFDRGQHDAQAAAIVAASTDRARALLLESSTRSLSSIVDELNAFEERRLRLRGTTIPLAQKIVDRLAEAVTHGAAPLQDLILARRTLAELSIDALDVELSTFKLSVTRARLAGATPPLPSELNQDSAP